MAKNIQMNVLGSDGQYEDIYPQTLTENVIGLQDELDGILNEVNSNLSQNYYTKQQIIQSSTLQDFNLQSTNVPDDVFQILSKSVLVENSGELTYIDGIIIPQVKICFGERLGTRVQPISITFPFQPDIWGYYGFYYVPEGYASLDLVSINWGEPDYHYRSGYNSVSWTISYNNNTVSYTHEGDYGYGCNAGDTKYYYYGIKGNK